MKLSVALLGEFSASVAGNRLELSSRKGQALLAFLALSSGGIARREILKALLWGDVNEKKSQSSLRYAVWTLNEILRPAGFDGLQSNRQQIILDPDRVDVDILQVLDSLNAGQPDARLLENESLIDSLLVGLDDVSVEFGHWVTSKRAQLNASVVPALTSAINRHADDSSPNLSGMVDVATLLNRLEPLNEIACQLLMRSRASSGDIAGALTIYQNLCHEMDQRQGMDPSDVTTDLAVAIKTGQITPTASGGVQQFQSPKASLHDKPWILLSAMDVSGAEQNQMHLFEGFRRELLASLIQFREWRIFDDSSGSQSLLRDANGGQAYKLELSATTRDNRMRLVLTLMDAWSGSYIWSDKIEDQIENFLNTQADIVRKLAMALNIGISSDRLGNLVGRADFPLEVFDHWLLAQQHIDGMTKAGWDEAEHLLDTLIGKQEMFARAHSARAEMENFRQLSFPGVISSDAQRNTALIHARRSVTLDPGDTRNQLSLAWARAMDGQFKGARMAFEQAYELNENDPWTSISVAMGLAFCGDAKRAIELAAEADRLNQRPTKLHWSYQAAIAFLVGDVHSCIHYSELAEEVTVDVLGWHIAALQISGQTLQARATATRFIELTTIHWQLPTVPTEREITDWLLRGFPIARLADWRRLRDALQACGLDIGEVDPPPGAS